MRSVSFELTKKNYSENRFERIKPKNSNARIKLAGQTKWKEFFRKVLMQFISLRLISLTSAPYMFFENHATAHASMAVDAFSKNA